ncbi:MAG: radical SAM protein [Clostridiales bacterium]|nr:radical SAM protein [Clostridiales bacterium]
MKYEGQVCRPPIERSSYILPASVGCAYNGCKFCTLFKHVSCRALPLGQIEDELRRVRDLGGNPRQVFLGDGNAFSLDTDRMMKILSMITQYFPACRKVNMDATVTDISHKTDAELRLLGESGVSHLYIGIESGLDDVLSFMNKEHGVSQAYMEIDRIQSAGMVFNAHIMTGVAGAGRGYENAEALSVFFNRTRPERVINFSMFLHQDAPLYKDFQSGGFVPADEAENLAEARLLLELTDVDSLFYDGLHERLELRVRGTLPSDRDKMLNAYDDAIKAYNAIDPMFAIWPF